MENVNEQTKVLKSRRDVLFFFAKNPHIDLQPEQFSFKLGKGDTAKHNESNPTDTKESESNPLTLRKVNQTQLTLKKVNLTQLTLQKVNQTHLILQKSNQDLDILQ